jgi:hypothetical protein
MIDLENFVVRLMILFLCMGIYIAAFSFKDIVKNARQQHLCGETPPFQFLKLELEIGATFVGSFVGGGSVCVLVWLHTHASLSDSRFIWTIALTALTLTAVLVTSANALGRFLAKRSKQREA